ncbi:MAG: endolytic transglycosylase MltG [Chloroflexi bacterium]|nr:MAG: endolytic transglycosylase MltG [Chloroflexota bacterium]TMC29298.1 MAG: endolytic transglycosylase MltG [Chloroflexota bacterium]TMC33473.1 MAG: endolytic transglycosylase MltG [Chloroflexota bacterium]TMC54982.1 MAG: endolytic transglycosylase MltG [Chloroflexota bacterium]TME39753.1 MAG: endolytic transglycosylase MltG [Chloroflexota bacterium]
MTPSTRGPHLGVSTRSRGRTRPPSSRSSAGPLVFLVVVAIIVFGVVAVARPLAEDAFVAYVTEHDTLLHQDFVRALVAPRVKDEIDLARDVRAESRPFVIARGETAGQIARHLESEGIVRSALAFVFVLYENGKESVLQSGTYTVSAGLTPRELAKLFEKAPGDQVVLRVIEGWRLTEIATAVEKAFPKVKKDDFIAAAIVGERKNTVLFGLDPKTSLEGFLFPDTYFLRPDATAAQIVDTLLGQFEDRAGKTLRTAAVQRKMSVYDLVKLASIVEREARDRSESPTIAGVYQNRLDIGMKLDADPTIQYAKGDWKELVLDDLKLESPYNTYLVAGLPPTPICSPGQAALDAAANPAEHDYLFFVAKNDGTGQHAFAKTIEEQEANRIKYGNR